MKGIILAGGSGTRLYPLTRVISKQLLPVYDKPMIYYPLTTLMLAGIRDILVISTPTRHAALRGAARRRPAMGHLDLLRRAAEPRRAGAGVHHRARFVGKDAVAWCSVTTSFTGRGSARRVQRAAKQDERRHGVRVLRQGPGALRRRRARRATARRSASKRSRKAPRSNFAVTGLYFYDNQVVDIAGSLRPSARGELEITDVNRDYLQRKQAPRRGHEPRLRLARHRDPRSLQQASTFIEILEHRQGLKIACPEEIAYRMGYIDAAALQALAGRCATTNTASICWRWRLSARARGMALKIIETRRSPAWSSSSRSVFRTSAGFCSRRSARSLPGGRHRRRLRPGQPSHSVEGTLRGLHFQEPPRPGQAGPGGSRGDLRRGGRHPPRLADVWALVRRRAVGGQPPAVVDPDRVRPRLLCHVPTADVTYKCTAPYVPGAGRGIAWNDPDIGITWPSNAPLLSPQDRAAPRLKDAPVLPGDPG